MAIASPLHALWSPQMGSTVVGEFRTLLLGRGEGWNWVGDPRQARWIVIDATQPLDGTLLTAIVSLQPGRRVIGLARAWNDLPIASWVFCRIPLNVIGVARILDPLLRMPQAPPAPVAAPRRAQATPPRPASGEGLRPVSSAPRPVSPALRPVSPALRPVSSAPRPAPARTAPQATAAPSGAHPPWATQHLHLRSWPNLSRYRDPQMRLLEATRRMLLGYVSYGELIDLVGDGAILDRLLDDAHRRGNLRWRLAVGEGPSAPLPVESPAQPSGAGLFQRFLSKFR